MTTEPPPLLDITDLRTYFRNERGTGRAVDGVDLRLGRGQTLGIVGESGSGKSMMARSLVGLHPKPESHIVSGSVRFLGRDLLSIPHEELREIRGAHIAMVFQDASAALNPLYTIGNQITEGLRTHLRMSRQGRRDRGLELLNQLRFVDPELSYANFPHQLSGGMQQRALSAIALACSPELLIADEPTTGLDVTVQAVYLDLLKVIQRELDLTIIFITHDLGIVERLCDEVGVMYAGQIVELASKEDLFVQPIHPYSAALVSLSSTVRNAGSKPLASIPGNPLSIYETPDGCRFRDRCWLYAELGEPVECRDQNPALTSRGTAGRKIRCHFPQESVELGPQLRDDGC